MQSQGFSTVLITALLLFLSSRIGLFFMFKKAGKPAWIALIPIVSWYYWLKMVNRPLYYIVLLCIPAVNIIAGFTITIDILRSFGQFKFWQQVLGVVFPFLWFPYTGLSKKFSYIGPANDEAFREKYLKHKTGREWADAIFFAIFVASGIRMFYIEAFKIPTGSMESSLMVGDFLFVSKINYGARIPNTPLAFPLVHQDLMGIKSYSDALQLPYLRVPGFQQIERGDPFVFNWPADKEDNGSGPYRPIDKKQHYIKRCVGLPGDSLQILNQVIYINGKVFADPPKVQYTYVLVPKGNISPEEWNDLDIYDLYSNNTEIEAKLTSEKANELRTSGLFAAVIKKTSTATRDNEPFNGRPLNSPGEFIENPDLKWTIDSFGVIYLPKRNDKIAMTKWNYQIYALAIREFEENQTFMWDENQNKAILNGKAIESYTFKYDYYWAMGDNRHNSEDSRFWGFVPETHIVGKPLFVWFSMKYKKSVDKQYEPDNSGDYDGIRWNRMFMGIK